MSYNAQLAMAVASVLISAKSNTRRQVPQTKNSIITGPIHPDKANYARILTMADKATATKKTFDQIVEQMLASKDPEFNMIGRHVRTIDELTINKDLKWGYYNAAEFTVLILSRANKPVSENLILKRLKQNCVALAVPRINILLAAMSLEGIIRNVGGKGYQLSKEMDNLIKEEFQKPERLVDHIADTY